MRLRAASADHARAHGTLPGMRRGADVRRRLPRSRVRCLPVAAGGDHRTPVHHVQPPAHVGDEPVHPVPEPGLRVRVQHVASGLYRRDPAPAVPLQVQGANAAGRPVRLRPGHCRARGRGQSRHPGPGSTAKPRAPDVDEIRPDRTDRALSAPPHGLHRPQRPPPRLRGRPRSGSTTMRDRTTSPAASVPPPPGRCRSGSYCWTMCSRRERPRMNVLWCWRAAGCGKPAW